MSFRSWLTLRWLCWVRWCGGGGGGDDDDDDEDVVCVNEMCKCLCVIVVDKWVFVVVD